MTLTQTAVITKQIITLTVIFSILGILSFIGYKIWYAYYLANLPVKEPVADTKFGILPPPDFPQSSVSSSNYSYTIDTATGNLPKLGTDEGFDKIIRVYFITQIYATFLSPEKGQKLAEKFGVFTSPQILSETNYQYKQADKTINIDLNTGNFIYTKEATSTARQDFDSDKRLEKDFQNFLSLLGVFKAELGKGQAKVVLLKKGADSFIQVNTGAEAEAAQISLWQDNVDQKPLLTSDFNKSLVNAIVRKSASEPDDYLSLNFTFWPIDLTTYATYPTKSPEEAFEDLKNGKGAIIIEPSKAQVSVSSIYLAYFLSNKYNSYLHPIYVFEGPEFVAYISAVSSKFIGTSGQSPVEAN